MPFILLYMNFLEFRTAIGLICSLAFIIILHRRKQRRTVQKQFTRSFYMVYNIILWKTLSTEILSWGPLALFMAQSRIKIPSVSTFWRSYSLVTREHIHQKFIRMGAVIEEGVVGFHGCSAFRGVSTAVFKPVFIARWPLPVSFRW